MFSRLTAVPERAAITGAYVALYQAVETLLASGTISVTPLKSSVAATSVGLVYENYLLDLCYEEDCAADVDFNVVMTNGGEFVEVQGTAEAKPFTREAIDNLLSIAEKGIRRLFRVQQGALATLKADPNR